MKSRWKVAGVRTREGKIYHVYRLTDTSVPSYISEREYCCGFVTSERKRAKALAAELNKKEGRTATEDVKEILFHVLRVVITSAITAGITAAALINR